MKCASKRSRHASIDAAVRAVLVAVFLTSIAALSPARAQMADTPSTEDVVSGWKDTKPHPLLGKIWRTASPALIDGIRLAKDQQQKRPVATALGLKGRDFILLGEIHDNPHHHQLRAGLLEDLTDRTAWGQRNHPPVVSEHIRADQQAGLDTFREWLSTRAQRPGVDDLFMALEWDKTGWQPPSIFKPLYAAALAARLPLRAGEPPRDRLRGLARNGLAAMPPEEVAKYGLAAPLPAPLADALNAELAGSHCGMLPASAIPGMALAQRYRDAHLAEAMIAAEFALGPTVLLAGNGHVRTDRGVPYVLRARVSANKTIRTVMLVEIEDGKSDPAAYVPRAPDGKPAADAVVFTPRAQRDDPCEKMRAHMKAKR